MIISHQTASVVVQARCFFYKYLFLFRYNRQSSNLPQLSV